MLRPKKTTITPAHLTSARQYCENCADRFKDLTFLVDMDRLPRETCGIKVTTVDAAEKERFKREERENQGNETGQDQFKARPLELLPQDKLISSVVSGIVRRLYLTGEGGTGKTEYSRLIALRAAERFLSENGSGGALVPYHVELKIHRGHLEVSWSSLLEKHLAVDDQEWLVPFASTGRVAFIFDGLDECGFDADRFSEALARLIQRFNTCVFVLAGRPRSLPPSLPGFDEKRHTHEIQPLTDEQIHYYAVGVFGHWAQTHEIALDAPGRFLAELRSNQHTLYPLIRTPFMLAFATKAFRATGALPSNPAALVALGLTELFEVRRAKKVRLPESNDACFDVLSTLAAFALVRPRGQFKTGPLSFSIAQAKDWLKMNATHIAEMRGASRPDAVAGRLIDELAPDSGVLFRTGNDLTFSNQVLAEFLASHWIANYGYPHWPYRDRIRHYVDPNDVPDERERQLLDFFGDFAWSNAYDPLAQAVRFQLGWTPGATATDEEKKWHASNVDLLIRCARWFHDTAEPFGCFQESSLDARATLVTRVAQFCQALPGGLSPEQEASVNAIVHAILAPEANWVGDAYWRAWIAKLPIPCRQAYLGPLLRSLNAAQAEKGWSSIGNYARAIAAAFSANAEAMGQLLQELTNALDAASADLQKNWSAIDDVARVIASSFSAHPSAMERALKALTDALDAAGAGPKGDWRAIGELADTIASAFSTNAEAMGQALKALTKALEAASADPHKDWLVIGVLARSIASGFSAYPSAMEQALKALTSTLKAACTDPIWDSWAISDSAFTIISAFSANTKAMRQVLQTLTNALDAAGADPRTNGVVIGIYARAIAAGFSTNATAMTQALQAATKALEAAIADPTKSQRAIGFLGGTIASDFLAGPALKAQALQLLIEALNANGADSDRNWIVSDKLARELSSGFPGNPDAAATLIRVSEARKLKIEAWSGWVTLWGEREGLHRCFIDSWGFSDDPAIIKPINEISTPDTQTAQQAVIVAPREKIRRGLPAFLLKAYSHPGAHASPPIVPETLKEPVSEVQSKADHSDDFTSVNWFGKHHTFVKGNQSEAVRVLWEAWEKGGHSLYKLTIAEKIGAEPHRFELGKVFRKRKPTGGYQMHSAWGTMIRQTEKGCYQLVAPQEHATSNAHE